MDIKSGISNGVNIHLMISAFVSRISMRRLLVSVCKSAFVATLSRRAELFVSKFYREFICAAKVATFDSSAAKRSLDSILSSIFSSVASKRMFISLWRESIFSSIASNLLSTDSKRVFISLWRESIFSSIASNLLSTDSKRVFISLWRESIFPSRRLISTCSPLTSPFTSFKSSLIVCNSGTTSSWITFFTALIPILFAIKFTPLDKISCLMGTSNGIIAGINSLSTPKLAPQLRKRVTGLGAGVTG